MIYVIGSGFSGLTTAYALYLRGIKSTVISPSEKFKKNNINLFNYLLKNNNEFYYNSSSLKKEILKINNTKLLNCKYFLSHSDGGQSNFWGGVVGNSYNYESKNSKIRKSSFFVLKKKYNLLLNLIGLPKIDREKIEKKNYINTRNYFVKKKNVSSLKKFLIKKKISFISNIYVKKIDFINNNLISYNLKNKEMINLSYNKVFISCGPVETAKLLINSISKLNRVTLKETRHFYCFLKIKKNLSSRFLDINLKKYKFYCQIYSNKDALSILYKKIFQKTKKELKKGYYFAQCYLDEKFSGKITINKNKNKFIIIGKENKNFKIDEFRKYIKKFNKKNQKILIKKFYFNQIGASNHLGCSFPIINNSNKINSVNTFGKLNKQKNIYLSDSSVLNSIDTSPLTSFSIFNLLRMVLHNKDIK